MRREGENPSPYSTIQIQLVDFFEMIAKIDVTPAIQLFDEHLKINDRIIFSAHFGDGKTCFLNEYMGARSDKYEFIVLYPVNYQIAPNEAIMEYIKRDILFQLILKGHIRRDVSIPDAVLFQWYVSQNQSSLIMDMMHFMTSLPTNDSRWSVAFQILGSISQEITNKVKGFGIFKKAIEGEGDFIKAAKFIESFSKDIYELDVISYLIIQTLQRIKDSGRLPVLVVEDLDRIDPAHLFRILNVFSSHIDRSCQCNIYTICDDKGNKIQTDELKNKFGFDKIIMVLDYVTTQRIFCHFYGEEANYQGYIGKFLSHNVFHYSVKEYAFSQLAKHLSSKCNLSVDMLLSQVKGRYEYISPDDISVRSIAQVLDSFEDSIIDADVYLDGVYTFKPFTPLTRTIATLRRLGFSDGLTLKMLRSKLDPSSLVDMMGGFLIQPVHIKNGFMVYYEGKIIKFNVEVRSGGEIIFQGSNINTLMLPENSKHLSVNIDEAFAKACAFVK